MREAGNKTGRKGMEGMEREEEGDGVDGRGNEGKGRDGRREDRRGRRGDVNAWGNLGGDRRGSDRASVVAAAEWRAGAETATAPRSSVHRHQRHRAKHLPAGTGLGCGGQRYP